jgi:hypothetical protein
LQVTSDSCVVALEKKSIAKKKNKATWLYCDDDDV